MSKIIFEAKNLVAKNHGFADWENIENSEMSENERNELKSSLIEEVAKATLELAIENIPSPQLAIRYHKISNELFNEEEFKLGYEICFQSLMFLL